MKRLAVPAFLAVVVLVLALAGMAGAVHDNWRVSIRGDNGMGDAGNLGVQAGVYPTSLDGLDPQDGTPYSGFGMDTDSSDVHLGVVVPGQTELYSRSIKAPTMPPGGKTWEFYVAGNVNYAYGQIRLLLFTLGSSYLPPTAFDGTPVAYAVQMLDNKGVAGAPANYTIWEVPTPTIHSSSTPFWTSPVFPAIVLSASSNTALRAEGYKLQLVQVPVIPEPSSILALGSGLLGLAGYALRRRRA